jgi:DNA (cytosine-5)-methyltransferase 1
VKQIATVQKGLVLKKILSELTDLGYSTDYRILNALDFGLPQKRERVIVIATLAPLDEFPWPTEPVPMKPLSEILEPNPDAKHWASQRIREKREAAHTADFSPAIWHENKAGNISSHPWSCALRAGASHNYLLVDGERRPTPRELLRLQGFPDSYSFVNDSQTRKQAGNAVPVPLVQAVMEKVVDVIRKAEAKRLDSTSSSYS